MGPIAQTASWDLTSNVRVKSLMPRLPHLWLGAEIVRVLSHIQSANLPRAPPLCEVLTWALGKGLLEDRETSSGRKVEWKTDPGHYDFNTLIRSTAEGRSVSRRRPLSSPGRLFRGLIEAHGVGAMVQHTRQVLQAGLVRWHLDSTLRGSSRWAGRWEKKQDS